MRLERQITALGRIRFASFDALGGDIFRLWHTDLIFSIASLKIDLEALGDTFCDLLS